MNLRDSSRGFAILTLAFLWMYSPCVIASEVNVLKAETTWANVKWNHHVVEYGVSAGGCQIGGDATRGDLSEYYRCVDIKKRVLLHALGQSYDSGLLKAASVQKLAKKFGNLRVSCRMTLSANGNVESIDIATSSGVKSIDRKAVALLKSSAPFAPSSYNESLVYLVPIPNLNVTPGFSKK